MSTAVVNAAFTARRALQHRQHSELVAFADLIDRIAALGEGEEAGPEDTAALARLMEPGGLPIALRLSLTADRRAIGHGADLATEEEITEAVTHRRNLRSCLSEQTRLNAERAKHAPPDTIAADLEALRADIAKRMRTLMAPVHALERKLEAAKSAVAQAEYTDKMVREAKDRAPWISLSEAQ